MLSQLLAALVLVPILGCLGCILLPKKWERTIFFVSAATISLELGLFLALVLQWVAAGAAPVSAGIGSLYSSRHYTFSLDFYFDGLAAVFLGVATLMAMLVFVFSRFYMHREQGFKRFYYTLLLFFIGLTLIILAGNFEVLFLGWEFIGVSSVLLIAFYRDRFLPARNALKVFSLYRIADAFLLAAIWFAHHLFEGDVHFSDLSGAVAAHGNQLAVLGLLLLAAAMIKSAQFPFSYWLPRAMEGPTTSSAIFYGALSVHMGLFLLLRTYPIWESSVWVRFAIALVGLVTAVVASSIARVQSSAKTQIAYASISQIGIMFVEVAAGLYWLALIHFVSNASLRAYQLLISPSTVSYLVHEQFFHFKLPRHKINHTLLGKMRATFYVLGVTEWNMNSAASRYVWNPLKAAGRVVGFLDKGLVQAAALVVFMGMVAAAVLPQTPVGGRPVLATAAACISLVYYVRAYATKNAARTCWNLIMLGNAFAALFLALSTGANGSYLLVYGMGVFAAFIAGHGCLWYLESHGQPTVLREYHGAIFAFKKLGHLFFILCLLLMAFPISPSFLVQDILVSSIAPGRAYQLVFFCLAYILVGISVMRLYTKVFFGPHTDSHHERAYKSS